MKRASKNLILLVFFCVECFAVQAQQKHFLYIQSEDKQPFAVVLNGKVLSSSDDGYIIVPKLADSTYTFTISFPMNKFPDQSFTYAINNKDAGFTLKNETNGWALENLQTQKTIADNNAVSAPKNTFGNMLSEVSNDADLTKKTTGATTVAAENIIAATSPQTAQIEDTTAMNNAGITANAVLPPEKIAEADFDTGTNMLFVDKNGNSTDTIHVFVPANGNENVYAVANNAADSAVMQPSTTMPGNVADNSTASSSSATDTSSKTINNPFYNQKNSAMPQNETAAASVLSDQTKNKVLVGSSAVRQDCTNMLSDDELDKIKRKIFVQTNTNSMVQTAVKSVGSKCLTTDQVKTLGNLFSSDDGRYNLYDALYINVYDYGNYPSLSGQILDSYYKKRFAAMLR